MFSLLQKNIVTVDDISMHATHVYLSYSYYQRVWELFNSHWQSIEKYPDDYLFISTVPNVNRVNYGCLFSAFVCKIQQRFTKCPGRK